MGYFIDAVKATGKITGKVASLFNEKLVQIALVGGIHCSSKPCYFQIC